MRKVLGAELYFGSSISPPAICYNILPLLPVLVEFQPFQPIQILYEDDVGPTRPRVTPHYSHRT